MAWGIPLELLTMLGSGLLGGLLSIWSMSIKAKAASHSQTLSMLKTQNKAVKDAREYENEGFQFTRRTIAILAVFAVIVWPKMVPVFWPDIMTSVGYTLWNPGFLFFDGSEYVTWESFKGLVLTPLDTHLMSSIVGLYFGSSLVRNAK